MSPERLQIGDVHIWELGMELSTIELSPSPSSGPLWGANPRPSSSPLIQDELISISNRGLGYSRMRSGRLVPTARGLRHGPICEIRGRWRMVRTDITEPD